MRAAAFDVIQCSSRRVLEKCGFVRSGAEVEDVIFKLEA